MLNSARCIRCMDLLARGLHLHSSLAGHRGGTLPQDFADFPHGGDLLGLPDLLVAVLATDTASRLLAGLLGIVFPVALAVLLLRVLGFVAGLPFLWLPLLRVLRLPIFAGLLLF